MSNQLSSTILVSDPNSTYDTELSVHNGEMSFRVVTKTDGRAVYGVTYPRREAIQLAQSIFKCLELNKDSIR